MSFLEQLPEVIEQIGRDVKAITVVLGKGRPDKPDTTGDKTAGEEPKIKVKLIGKRVFKVKLTNQQYMPVIPNINDLILNYKIGRL